MRSYITPKAEKRPSSTNGTGLFATEIIQPDEIVAIKSGDVLREREAKALAEEIGDYYLQIDSDHFFSPRTIEDVPANALQINHSCQPNVGLRGSVVFIALETIFPDTELTYDVAMTTAHEYSLQCNCQKENCRKVITGRDWRIPELQERYGDHFSTYICELIRRS